MRLGERSDVLYAMRYLLQIYLATAAILCCHCGEQHHSGLDLSEIYQMQDTLGYRELIETQHRAVREALWNQREDYLAARLRGERESPEEDVAVLAWLTDKYRELTGISDLSRRLAFVLNCSDRNLAIWTALDSAYAKAQQDSSSQEQIERLLDIGQQFASLGDTLFYASTLFEVGDAFNEVGVRDSAIAYLETCARICREMGDLSQLGDCELLTAWIYSTSEAEYSRTERHYSAAASHFRQVGHGDRAVNCFLLRAYTLISLHQDDRAIQLISEYLRTFGDSLRPSDHGQLDYYLAEAYINREQLDSAERYAGQSLGYRRTAVSRSARQLEYVGYSHSCLGFILQAKGDYKAAAKQYEQAQETFDRANSTDGSVLNLSRRASLHLETASYKQATADYVEVLTVARHYEERLEAMYGLAAAAFYSGRHAEAKRYLRHSIDLAEAARYKVASPAAKQGALTDRARQYDLLAITYLSEYTATGLPRFLDSASHFHQRGSCISLWETLTLAGHQGPSQDERELLDRLSVLRRRALLGNTDLESVYRDIRQLEDSLFSLSLAKPGSGADSLISYDAIPGIENIRGCISDSSTAVLDYLISDFGCYVFTFTADSVTVDSIEASQKLLIRLIDEVIEEVSTRPTGRSLINAYRKTSRWLFDLLLAERLRNMPGCDKLIVVASGPLQRLPFGLLLTDDGRHLIADYDIAYLPSLRLIRPYEQGRNGVGAGRLLAVADPAPPPDHGSEDSTAFSSISKLFAQLREYGSVPFAAREVDSLIAVFGKAAVITLQGEAATESALKEENLSDVGLLHFATHGYCDLLYPERSALVLSPLNDSTNDGLLQPVDIMQLSLQDKIVFLSACRTGTGKLYPGEGMLTLTRPFLVAGARSVVVTLWDVDDRCSASLVASFYRGIAQGLSAVTALAEAQRGLIRSQRELYRHPYFWAPFVIIDLHS